MTMVTKRNTVYQAMQDKCTVPQVTQSGKKPNKIRLLNKLAKIKAYA